MSNAPLPTRAEEAREADDLRFDVRFYEQIATSQQGRAERAEAEVARLKSAVEKAERERDEAKAAREQMGVRSAQKRAASKYASAQAAAFVLNAAEAEVARLTERVAALEGALKPFISHYAKWMDDWDADVPCNSFARVTFGQLRAARAALHGGDQ